MEEQWVIDRAKLRTCLTTFPHSSTRQLMAETGRGATWVHKWKKRLAGSDPADVSVIHSRSRRRKQPAEPLDPRVVKAILAVRDEPPAQLGRVPGPRFIGAHLNQDADFLQLGLKIPSTTTIWKVLRQHQRIIRQFSTKHEAVDRPTPMTEWEIDFMDVDTATPEPEGKRQHIVEVLNIVDRGTSLLVDSLPATDFNQETALITMTDVFAEYGLPQALRMDRDPRFVASWGLDGFPSAFVRFLLCLGLRVDICPPRRPDLKPFVERFNRTLKYELILLHKPTTLEATLKVLVPYKSFFNENRPHQGSACHDLAPRVAFPDLPALPRPPAMVDSDSWLKAFDHKYIRRRISPKGTVAVDNDRYYVGKRFAGQYALLQIDAPTQCFQVEVAGKPVKTLPLKCLLGGLMPFEDYFELMLKQARSEVRRLSMAARQRHWLGQRAA